jgi:hypothetical protein
MTCLGFEIGLAQNVCHMEISKDFSSDHLISRARKLVSFVLSQEGLLVRDLSAVDVSNKLVKFYESMLLTSVSHELIRSLLPEKQFLDICQRILLPEKQMQTVAVGSMLQTQINALSFSYTGRSWFNTTARMKHREPSLRSAMGVCATATCLNDKIVVLRGCSFPVLLRERPEAPGTYVYIKEVYLHGFMHGEGIGQFEEQFFEISIELHTMTTHLNILFRTVFRTWC